MSGKTNCINLNVILNMGVSAFVAMLLGMFLRIFNLQCWFVCGMVAVCAVVVEHLLTIHPIDVLAKVNLGIKWIKDKVASLWKK